MFELTYDSFRLIVTLYMAFPDTVVSIKVLTENWPPSGSCFNALSTALLKTLALDGTLIAIVSTSIPDEAE